MLTASSPPPPPCRRHLTFLVHRTCFVHPGKRHLGKRRDSASVKSESATGPIHPRDSNGTQGFLSSHWTSRYAHWHPPELGFTAALPGCESKSPSRPRGANARKPGPLPARPHVHWARMPCSLFSRGDSCWFSKSFSRKITIPVTTAGVGRFSIRRQSYH